MDPSWERRNITSGRVPILGMVCCALPVLEAFVKLNAMGWHTFLDMVDAAARGATVEPREACMKRNAERYGIDLSKLPKG